MKYMTCRAYHGALDSHDKTLTIPWQNMVDYLNKDAIGIPIAYVNNEVGEHTIQHAFVVLSSLHPKEVIMKVFAYDVVINSFDCEFRAKECLATFLWDYVVNNNLEAWTHAKSQTMIDRSEKFILKCVMRDLKLMEISERN